MLQRFVDAAAVEAEIERVRSLSGAALRRRWQAEFGRPLPRSLTVELLRRMIANRIQEEAFGTLDRRSPNALVLDVSRASELACDGATSLGRNCPQPLIATGSCTHRA